MGLLRGGAAGLGLGIPHLHVEEELEVVTVQRIESPRARRGDGWLQAGLERLVVHVRQPLQGSEALGELLVLWFLAEDLDDAAL